ncbi:MAG: DUF1059 domain-containing protein [Pseudomonadota bacterium]
MAHVLDCQEVDFADCQCEFRGASPEDVVEKVLEYGRRKHNICGMVPALREKLRNSVLEEPEVW